MIKSLSHGSSLVKNKIKPEDFRWFSFTNIDRGKFVCVACFSRFDTRFLMNLHRITQCTMLPYKCDVCELRFSMKSRLLYHQRIHGIMQLPIKEESNASSTSNQNTNIQREVINDINFTYRCSKCNLSFVGKRKLERHERIHSDKKYYKCDRCHLGFSWKSNFNRHRKNSCVRKEYPCDKCNRTFSKKLYLMRHQTTHIEDNTLVKQEHAEQEVGSSTSSQGNSAEKESYLEQDQKPNVVPSLELSPTNSRSKRLQDILKHPVKDELFSVSDNKSSQEDGLDMDYEPKKKRRLENRYRCLTCGTGFKWKCDLARHWRTHASMKPFLCDKCELGFNWKSNLVRHQKRVHLGTEGFVCDTCGRGFVKQYHLSRHRNNDCGKPTSRSDNDNSDGAMKTRSSNIVYDYNAVSDEGDYNYKIESNPVMVQVHPKGKHDLLDPQASSSKEQYDDLLNLYHIAPEVNIVYLQAIDDKGQSYQSEEGSFENSSNFLQSKLVESEVAASEKKSRKVNQRSCSKNKRETKKEAVVKTKQKTSREGSKTDANKGSNIEYSAEKPTKKELKEFPCSVCNRVFSRKSCHTQHERSHYKQRLQCEWCHRSFDRNSVLVRHQRIHTGEKPYQCEGCLSYFRQKSQLVQHRKIHTGVKQHECEVCKRRFNRRSILVRHKMIHTGEKPFECEVCHLCFNQKSILVQHQKIHSGLKPYKCKKCNYSFTQKWNYRRHKERVHTSGKKFSIKCNSCDSSFPRKKILIQHQEIHKKKVVVVCIRNAGSSKKVGKKKNPSHPSVLSKKRDKSNSKRESENPLQSQKPIPNVVDYSKNSEKFPNAEQETDKIKEISAFEDKGTLMKIHTPDSLKIEENQDSLEYPKEKQVKCARRCLKNNQSLVFDDENVKEKENNHVNLDFLEHKNEENCKIVKQIRSEEPRLCSEKKPIDANTDMKIKTEADVNHTPISRDIATDDFRISKEAPAQICKNKNEGNKILHCSENVKNEQFLENKLINQDECIKNNRILESNAVQTTLIIESVDSAKTFQETKECSKEIQDNAEIQKEIYTDTTEGTIEQISSDTVNFQFDKTNRVLVVHTKEDISENSYSGKNSHSLESNISGNKIHPIENESNEKTGNNINDDETLKNTLKNNLHIIGEDEKVVKTDKEHTLKFERPSQDEEEIMHISIDDNVSGEHLLGTKYEEKEASFTYFKSTSALCASCKHPELTEKSQRKVPDDKGTERCEDYCVSNDKKYAKNIHPKMGRIKGSTRIEDSDYLEISKEHINHDSCASLDPVSDMKPHDFKITGINSDNAIENLDQNVKNESFDGKEESYFVTETPEKSVNLKTSKDVQHKKHKVKLAIRKVRRGKGDQGLNDDYEIAKDEVHTQNATFDDESHRKSSRKLKRSKSITSYKKIKSSKKIRLKGDLLAEEKDEINKCFLDLKESVIRSLTSLKIQDDCNEDLKKEANNVAENDFRTANNRCENNLIKNKTDSSNNTKAFEQENIKKDEHSLLSFQVSKEPNRTLSDGTVQNEQVFSHQHEKTNENDPKLEPVVNKQQGPEWEEKYFEGHASNNIDEMEEHVPHIDKCDVPVEKIHIDSEPIYEENSKKEYPYELESAPQLDQVSNENLQNENGDFPGNIPNDPGSFQSDSRSINSELSIKDDYKSHPAQVNTYQTHGQENFLEENHTVTDDIPIDQNSYQECQEDVEYFLEKIQSKKETCQEKPIGVKHTESSDKKARSDDFTTYEEHGTDNNTIVFAESTYQNSYYTNTDQVSSQEICNADPNDNQKIADNQVSSSLSPNQDQNTIRHAVLAENNGFNENQAAIASSSNDLFRFEKNICSLPVQNNEFYDGSNASHSTNDSNKNTTQYSDIDDGQIFFHERIPADQNFIGYEKLQPYQEFNLGENIQSQVIIPKETFIPNTYKPVTQALPGYTETFSRRNSYPNDVTQLSGLFFPEYNSNNQSFLPDAASAETNSMWNVENLIPYKETSSQNFLPFNKTHAYQDSNWNKEIHTISQPKEAVHVPNNPPMQEPFNSIAWNQTPGYYDNNYQYPIYNEDSYNYSLRQEKVRTYSVHHEEIHTVQDLIRLEKTYAYPPTPHKVLPTPVPVQPHCIEPGYNSPVRYREVLINKQREVQMNVPVQGSTRLKVQPLQFPPRVNMLPAQDPPKLNLLPAPVPTMLNTQPPKDILEKNPQVSPGPSRLTNQGSTLLKIQISPRLNTHSSYEPNLLIKPLPQYPTSNQFFHHQVNMPSPKFRIPSSSSRDQNHPAKASTLNQSISLKALQDQDWCKRVIINNDISKRIRFGPGNGSRMYVNDVGHPKEVPDTLFGCDKCNQNFNRKEDLIRHRFTVHEKVRAARFCSMKN
ncbi:UNVERIFIED_CONTAM: zinc finger protein 91 [Trichonephila clavipes]